MKWSDISFTPSATTLRQFAGLCLVFFGGLAIWYGFFRDSPLIGSVLAVLALTIGPLGLVRPALIRPIFVGWMIIAFPIGWTVSRILLALIYYGVFTPIGLFLKLIGRDVLARSQQPTRDSYWETKPMPATLHSYFRQF